MGILDRISVQIFLLAGLLCGVSKADMATLQLDGNPGQPYKGINAGPYPGTLTGTNLNEFFCLSGNLVSNFGASYDGTTSLPSGQNQDEVAFLTSYLLSKGAPSSDPNFVAQYEGPITLAIWQIMGTLSGSPDPAAAPFVTLAEEAYADGLLTQAFLSNFLVFTPTDPAIQSFITGFRDDAVSEAVPEPKAALLIAGGLLAVFIWRWRHRTAPPLI